MPQADDAVQQARTARAPARLHRRQILSVLIGGTFFLVTGCKGAAPVPKPIRAGRTRKYLKGAAKGAGKIIEEILANELADLLVKPSAPVNTDTCPDSLPRDCGGFCCGSGEVCCDAMYCGTPCGNGRCCPVGSSCCGGKCCAYSCCGGKCCAQSCCTDTGTCCDYAPGTAICCPNGGCCPNGSVCCPNGGCCPQGEACCGTGCCKPGQTCSNGKCCPADHPVNCGNCCGRSCCSSTGTCCSYAPNAAICCPNGGCCPNGQACCGTGCCRAGAVCRNGSCYAR